ncbi:MAG TPA: response regulator [Candidatus Angelobacter sp.]|nr:response regulator [Candidatus Angelobacter sp.]
MSLKVLVVEDHVPSLELISEVLASTDAEVRPMSDSEEASALVEKERFDGIFLDLQMPKVHGRELVKRIRESSCNKSTAIIVITGDRGRRTMQSVFKEGATFFLEKPIDRHRLLRLFRAVRGTLSYNRRQFARISFRAEVTYESKGVVARGISSNLSLGGILFEAPQLRSGDAVRLSFRLPSTNVLVDALGKVVRVDERHRAGVRFIDVNETAKNAIQELVDREQ